jgi:hypothetical protein
MNFGKEQIILSRNGDVWFAKSTKAYWIGLRALIEEPTLAVSALGQRGYKIGLGEIEAFLAKATRYTSFSK